jgi:hypothetical protein
MLLLPTNPRRLSQLWQVLLSQSFESGQEELKITILPKQKVTVEAEEMHLMKISSNF